MTAARFSSASIASFRRFALRERRAEQEAARLGADDDVDAQVAREVRKAADRHVEALRRGEHRRDVLKDDPRLGEVRDVAHERAEVGHGGLVVH